MDKKESVVLAIEAGIGCSVTLLSPGSEPTTFEAEGEKRRADELAALIATAINGRRHLIGRIAVGDDAGSTTGLRVGIASALGLGSALGIPVMQLSLMSAMAELYGGAGETTVVVGTASRIFFGDFVTESGRVVAIKTGNTSKVDDLLQRCLSECAGRIVTTGDARLICGQSPEFERRSGDVVVCDIPLSAIIAAAAAGDKVRP